MLLHSEGAGGVFDWFNLRWQRNFTRLANLLTDARIVGTDMRLNRAAVQKIHDEFMLIEHVCARWATQPISEWTTEQPPKWLLTGVKPPSVSEDGGE